MAGGVSARSPRNNRLRLHNVLFFNAYNLEFMQQKLRPFDLEAAMSGEKIIRDGDIGEYRFTNRSQSGIHHVFQFEINGRGDQGVLSYEEKERVWMAGVSDRKSLCQEVFMAPEKKTIYLSVQNPACDIFYSTAFSSKELAHKHQQACMYGLGIHEITIEV